MKNSVKILLVAVTFVCLSFVNFEKKQINVVIDAGHGGTDFGATVSEVKEKEIVSAISKKIQLLNSDADVKIHFTRTEDNTLTLQERVDIMNEIKPDLFISLHINSNKNVTANGYEVYVSDTSIASEKSKQLAEKFVNTFSKNTKLRYRGIKTAPFFVLKKAEYPAILLDLGFLSNEVDKDYITSENGQTEIAQNILNFVSDLKE